MESDLKLQSGITKHFIVDNSGYLMKEALNQLNTSDDLDICTAFIDAYGISVLWNNNKGKRRLLVGYDLADIPKEQDIITFQMADEYQVTGNDPVHRVVDEASAKQAIRVLSQSNFEVQKAAQKTHSKLYVNGHTGIVGSSNLTRLGIEGQRELNLIQYQPEAVSKLREWFESNWNEAKKEARSDYKKDLIKWIEEAKLKRYSPFHPYAKAIFERYRNRFISLSSSSSDVNLAVFQEEGRDTALNILAEHKCCIIADAVGLGKTYVALGAMQRRAKVRPKNERKILVICPAQLESVWSRTADDQGIALITESMETLGNTTNEVYEKRIKRLSGYALVIVDESHNFRNPNSNRFKNLMEVLQGGPQEKEVLLLTATPINNSIRDLYSLYRLMTRDRDDFFVNTNLRIRSLREFFKNVERESISTTDLLLETMVCRSRLDIRRRQDRGETIVINEKQVCFPERRMEALEYSLSKSAIKVQYDELSERIGNLTLGAYNVEQYTRTPDNFRNQTYQRLQSLFKILLLKRLESSIVSFVSTAERLLQFSDKVVEALKKGKQLTKHEFNQLQFEFPFEFDDNDKNDETAYFEGLLERDPHDYDLDKLTKDVQNDKKTLQPLIDNLKGLIGLEDGKIAQLKKKLTKLLPQRKVLLFTFYADTANYIYSQLIADEEFMVSIGNSRIEKISGNTKASEKTRIVEDFAPKSNGVKTEKGIPIQLLISTDVLSEGQNLQDCGYLINYDLHFNPVRMIQRNGRIDRLNSLHKEITIANFFPEGGLEKELGLIEKLQKKIERIQDNLPVDSSVIGETVRVFSLDELRRTRNGDITIIDDIDSQNPINRFHDMLNEVIKMLQEFGIEEISKIPYGCQSNKRSTRKGVFICVASGRQDDRKNCWWLYYPLENSSESLFSSPIMDASQILDYIRSAKPNTIEEYFPDYTPREIQWEVVLDAKNRCRDMLIEQFRNEAKGQLWAQSHINKKVKTFLAVRPIEMPNELSRRLGRFSLEKYRKQVEEAIEAVKKGENIDLLIGLLDEKLPNIVDVDENPETIPLEVVSYLELVPELEGTK